MTPLPHEYITEHNEREKSRQDDIDAAKKMSDSDPSSRVDFLIYMSKAQDNTSCWKAKSDIINVTCDFCGYNWQESPGD